MQIQKDQFSQSFSIIGMDLFTHECPDLKSFKTLLLTSDYKNIGVNGETEPLDKSLQAIGLNKSAFIGLTQNERLLLLVLERALIDADFDQSHTGEISFSTVIHFPTGDFFKPLITVQDSLDLSLAKIVKLSDIPVILEKPVVIRDSFKSALEQSFYLLQNPSTDLVALFSPFSYLSLFNVKPELNATRLNANLKKTHLTGLGCIVLSSQANIKNSYADIVIGKPPSQLENGKVQFDPDGISLNYPIQPIFENSNRLEPAIPYIQHVYSSPVVLNGVEDSDEKTNDDVYPHILYVPIIRLIQSTLGLNSRTCFPDSETSWQDEIVIGEESQSFFRPWFPLPYTEKRESIIRMRDRNESELSIHLEKRNLSGHHPDQQFLNFGLFLLPIFFDDPQQIIQKIDEIKKGISDCPNLAGFISESLIEFENRKSGAFTMVALGASKQEFLDELEHARSGVPKSLESGRDWQTPSGSYFTPNPFGPNEKIAFIYPGAFGTYIGMGREIFYLFPQLYDALLALTLDPGNTINEKTIFPQSLTSNVREALQNELNNNPTQMISSGICFSYLYTVILRDIFKIKPDAAFGYSLGENSMMYAMGIWTQADAMRTSLETSPIFHTRVSGPQNAIREFWNMTVEKDEKVNPSIWANYVLMAPFETVREAIQNEEHVYITHINTPRQVVIGGEKNACQRIADEIKCMHLQAPYHHAIHCKPVASEFDLFMHLHDWPVENQPDIPIYTAANYAALQYDSKYIANCFAKMLTNPIDFPRLVNLAYEDGARIFIELGAGSNCSKWVEATLKGKPHMVISINQNNVDDHVSILRLLARLVSHQIPVDLKALKGNSYESQDD